MPDARLPLKRRRKQRLLLSTEAERLLAVHKLLVSKMRTTNLGKVRKDLQQACTLLAMLGEHAAATSKRHALNCPSPRLALEDVLPTVERVLAAAHEGSWLELRDSLPANAAL